MTTLYLASKSPRRLEILHSMGLTAVEVLPLGKATRLAYEGDEEQLPGEAPNDYVTRIARGKAIQALKKIQRDALPFAPVLAADTAVIVDEKILGKPQDTEEELEFLSLLSGRTHVVRTHVVLALNESSLTVKENVSRVHFKALSQEEKLFYAATNEPYDKAGGYAIQGIAAQFIDHIEGSFSGIMGLPIFETSELLKSAGLLSLTPEKSL